MLPSVCPPSKRPNACVCMIPPFPLIPERLVRLPTFCLLLARLCPPRRPRHPLRRRGGLVLPIIAVAVAVVVVTTAISTAVGTLVFCFLALLERKPTTISVAHSMRKCTDLVSESNARAGPPSRVGAAMARRRAIRAACADPPGSAVNNATTGSRSEQVMAESLVTTPSSFYGRRRRQVDMSRHRHRRDLRRAAGHSARNAATPTRSRYAAMRTTTQRARRRSGKVNRRVRIHAG